MLSEIDIEILTFIYKNNEVHISEILKKFPENLYSTSFRLSELCETKYKNITYNEQIPISNSSYICCKYENIDCFSRVSLDIYYMSKLGTSFIENHNRFIKNQKSDFRKQFALELMRSVMFPVIVSFLTALITIWINRLFNFV